MPLFGRKDRDALGAGAMAFAFLALIVSLGAVVVTINADSDGGSSGATASATATLSEYAIAPSPIIAPVDGNVAVTNSGTIAHNLAVEGTDKTTKDLNGGQSDVLSLKGVPEGEHTVICTIAGHKELGMKATIKIGTGGPAVAKPSGSSGHTDEELRAMNDEMDATMGKPVGTYVSQVAKITEAFSKDGSIDPSLYEANTDYGEAMTNPLLGPPVLEPKVLADGRKEFNITAKVVEWETEPGKKVSAWTYNGMVPGPTIKVNMGDRVRIRLDNQLPQSTAIHFHGIDLPVEMDGVPDVTQGPVKPGDTFNYDFTITNRVQVGMYHSHHHAEHQVPDGLAGAFLVGDMPIESIIGKPTADLRLPMMLNDAGSIGLTLNGKSFPATAPVVAVVGQWVQIDYLNEGLTGHPMHLHGVPQLVIAKDGTPLQTPYSSDTIMVNPGERYSVLFQATPELLGTAKDGSPTFGIWAYHCHILTHAERDDGMFGMVTTFIVAPEPKA